MICSRDGYAFEQLVVPLRDELLTFAVKLAKNRAVADDIVQDAMVRALRAWPRWESDDPDHPWHSVFKWMKIIVGNTFLNYTASYYYKTSKKLNYLFSSTNRDDVIALGCRYGAASNSIFFSDLFVKAANSFGVDNHWAVGASCNMEPPIKEEFSDFVERAVQRLPSEWQTILRMYAGGMTQKEIASELGMKVSTVSTRLVRAFDRIRPLLATYASSQGHSAARAWQQTRWGEPPKVVQADPDAVHGVV